MACWPAGLKIQTTSRNFITEQTIASFPYWGPSLVCSPSMLLFCQGTDAFQPSAPHTSLFFLSPCPASCFPSLRIKVARSGRTIYWALDLPTSTWPVSVFQVVLACVAGWTVLWNAWFAVRCLKLFNWSVMTLANIRGNTSANVPG